MSFYRRNLPHWQPDEAEFFITFRLANSLPANAVKQLNYEREILRRTGQDVTDIQRKIFAKYEQLLDNSSSGPTFLKKQLIAKIVSDALHYRDQNDYDLYAYCIMPNHVHLIFKFLNQNKSTNETEYPVTKMLHELKRYTAVECNKILDRTGQFWQHESFDRVIRNKEELEKTIKYVLNNPVKAGLVKYWENWHHCYCKHRFIDTFKSNYYRS